MLLCVQLLAIAVLPKETSPPHIVTILSDDLGYYDRSQAGNKNVSTPSIDALFEVSFTEGGTTIVSSSGSSSTSIDIELPHSVYTDIGLCIYTAIVRQNVCKRLLTSGRYSSN